MKVIIKKSYHDMSAAAADLIIEKLQQNPALVMCFATGNTPVLTYALLSQKAKEQKIDFSKCFCFGLDEWLGVQHQKKGSCHFTLFQQVFTPLGIKSEQVHLFNGMTDDIDSECSKMNETIKNKGGIDLMLAGIGINGHIGFNEPGVDIGLSAHDQLLHTSTVAGGQLYFNEPTIIKKGITLGMAQVMESRTLLLLANGIKKAAIIKQSLQNEITIQIPSSYIQQHRDAIVILDKEAASAL